MQLALKHTDRRQHWEKPLPVSTALARQNIQKVLDGFSMDSEDTASAVRVRERQGNDSHRQADAARLNAGPALEGANCVRAFEKNLPFIKMSP